jgi:hypothetical protein
LRLADQALALPGPRAIVHGSFLTSSGGTVRIPTVVFMASLCASSVLAQETPSAGARQAIAQYRAHEEAQTPVRRALGRDSLLQAADSETQYVLLVDGPRGPQLVARFTNRQALHLAGRSQGRLRAFGWFAAGQVARVPVYFYLAGGDRTTDQDPRVVPGT